jgi:AcrR family transcriptional regulator
MPRLSRKQKQAHTRTCLMESAAKVFARRGLQQASIDEVAGDAGFTKGAFYANFKSKEELFLAMLDERFAQRIEQIDRVWTSEGDLQDKARRSGQDFADYLSDDEWSRLFFEFAAYAARNEDFRQELVTRYRALRDRVADLYRRRKDEMGIEPSVSPEQVAVMTFAMANGLALEKLLEPDVVADDAFGTMLVAFFAGLGATSGAEAPDPA